ncbi:MAG: hypothetical protein QOG63_2682, partial [Thermoleophilaceae bacterium]|nr:hypothetical protein [Thermoleophilaceae bacterium]
MTRSRATSAALALVVALLLGAVGGSTALAAKHPGGKQLGALVRQVGKLP